MRYDSFQKLEEYKLLEAVKVILLIDTVTPRVMVWRRGPWSCRYLTGQSAIEFVP